MPIINNGDLIMKVRIQAKLLLISFLSSGRLPLLHYDSSTKRREKKHTQIDNDKTINIMCLK
jgi:hypothetical protein